MLCGAHLYSLDPKLRCCCYCCTYFLAHAAAACLLHFFISLYFSHLCIFSTKNKLAKLKGLLLGSKHACDKNRRSSVTYASISVFPPHSIPTSRTTKYVVCCCCPHCIKSRSDLYSVPSNIRIGPTDANAFRGHRLTTQKGYTYAAYKTRNIFLKKFLGS